MTTSSVSPGQGFWMESTSSQDVFLAGEVVLDEAYETILYPSLNQLGYPYSSPVELQDTELWSLATNGNALLGPLNTAASPEEPAFGRGYWVNVTSEECVVWRAVRPYENAFPTNDEPPAIAGIEVLPEGSGVVLSVFCQGIPAASLDVFYQDLSLTNRFEAASSWKIAADNLPVQEQEILQWTDLGSAGRLPPGEVAGRYYLIGRADLDLNGNGVPDAREQFVYGTQTDAQAGVPPGMSGGSAATPTGPQDVEVENTNLLNQTTGTNALPEPPAIVLSRVIYVDQKRGSDSFSGRLAEVVVGDGPKKTLAAGLNAVESGGAMVIRTGNYEENLNIVGRDVRVRVKGTVRLAGPATRPGVVERDTSAIVTNAP